MIKALLTACLLLSLTAGWAQPSAFNKHGFYVPRNLTEANEQLDKVLTAKARDKFKALHESDLINVSGLFITGEWDDDDSRFLKFLNQYVDSKQKTWGYLDWQVRDHLVYLSYLRHLNNQAFDLTKEISKVYAKADSIAQLHARRRQRNILADSIDGVYIPKNLKDSFAQLDRLLPDTLKQKLKHPDPEYGLSMYHFSLGLWMRNNWQLWGGSRLQKYFEGLGVHHPDDMSGIILRSYSDYLNGKSIDERAIKPLTVAEPTPIAALPSPPPPPPNFDKKRYYTKEYKQFLRKRKIDNFESLPPEAYAE